MYVASWNTFLIWVLSNIKFFRLFLIFLNFISSINGTQLFTLFKDYLPYLLDMYLSSWKYIMGTLPRWESIEGIMTKQVASIASDLTNFTYTLI